MVYLKEAYDKLDGVESKYRELSQEPSLSRRLQLKNKSLAIIAQMMKEFPPKDESGLIGLTLEMVIQRLNQGGVNEGTAIETVWYKIRQVGFEIGVEMTSTGQGKNLYIKEIN